MSCFERQNEGQGLVEYVSILMLVGIVVIAILALLGPEIGQVFSEVVAALNTASGAATPVADAGGPYTISPASPPKSCRNQFLDYRGSHDPDPDDEIVLHEWDWNNDGTFNWSTPAPESYPAYSIGPSDLSSVGMTMSPGDTITIVLRVTDGQGHTDTDSTTVTLDPGCPTLP